MRFIHLLMMDLKLEVFFFLDISKPLDKVWHEEIIFKLQQNGISDDLLNIKELRLMVSPLQGPKLMQGSPKDLS